MSKPEEFTITNRGVLTKYKGGWAREVTIPDGVTKISRMAFYCCNPVKIVLSQSVTEIGSYAFYLCGAESIVLSESVSKIEEHAFDGCGQSKVRCKGLVYVDNWVIDADKHIKDAEIKEGTVGIADGAFSHRTDLCNITLPGSIVFIGSRAFENCKSLTEITIPAGVRQVGELAFLGCDNLRHIHMAHDNADTAAAAMVYQTDALWWPPILKAIEEGNIDSSELLKSAADKLAGSKRIPALVEKRITELMQLDIHAPDAESVQIIRDTMAAKKSKLATKKSKLTEKIQCSEAEHLPFKMTKELERLKTFLQKNILISEKDDASFIDSVLLVLSECLNIPDKSQLDDMTYWADTFQFSFSDQADQAVSKVDRKIFLSAMQELVSSQKCIPAALALIRYGREEQTEFLVTQMDEWKEHKTSKICRRAQIIGRTALLESTASAAALFFEKNKQLEEYANHHHTNRYMLWFTKLLNTDFDSNGTLTYDLGSKSLEVRFQPDATLELYDVGDNKIVKRVPKANIDPECYAQVTGSLKNLKAHLKYVIKHGRDFLLDEFTNGEGITSENWKECCQGFLQRYLLEPLIWEQDGKTFRLTESGLLDSNEAPVVLQPELPIRLAHPMELPAEVITAWQKYFTAHDIRQPFLQIWQPIVDFPMIADDRYDGYLIPYNWLRNQEKRGIKLQTEYVPVENITIVSITFKDCTAKVEQPDWGDSLQIKKLHPQYQNRCTNNIIAFLDYLTIRQRIERDDVTCADILSGFTLAQIIDFINIAAEHHSTNVSVLLLNYKNEHFSDFDPMEEFILE